MKNVGRRFDNFDIFMNDYFTNMNKIYQNYFEDPIKRASLIIDENNSFPEKLEKQQKMSSILLKEFAKMRKDFKGFDSKLFDIRVQQKELNQRFELNNEETELEKRMKQQFVDFKLDVKNTIDRIQNNCLDLCTKNYAETLIGDLKECIDIVNNDINERFIKLKKDIFEIKTSVLLPKKKDTIDPKENREFIIKIQKELDEKHRQLEHIEESASDQKSRMRIYGKKIKKLLKKKDLKLLDQKVVNIENTLINGDSNIVHKIDRFRSRLSKLEDQYETKLERDQFFEFIGENFTQKKIFKLFELEMKDYIDVSKEKLDKLENYIKRFKFNIEDKVGDVRHLIRPLEIKL